MNKEAIVGISVFIAVIVFVGYVSGIDGLRYLGLTMVAGLFAMFLFGRKSKVAKGRRYISVSRNIYKTLNAERHETGN